MSGVPAASNPASASLFSRLKSYFQSHPTAIWFFFWGELAERCSFYGVKVILVVYMTKTLQMSDGDATRWESWFTAACFFTPLLGGWIADRYLGKYWTIVGFAIPFVLGNALLMLEGQAFLFIGLAIIALGSGVIKPNISSLMGMTYEQQRPGKDQLRSDAFTMFYWAINVGSLISKLIMPRLRDYRGPNQAFILPTVLMTVALTIFALGKRFYAVDIPTRKAPLTPEEKQQRWFVFFRLLGVFALIIVFWSIYFQKDNVWVLFVRDKIDTRLFGVTYSPDQFSFLNAFFILTLLPLVSVLFKVLGRFGINLRPTDKMLFGFVFTALAAATFVTVDLLPSNEKHSLLWIIFAFIFLTIGEILISPVGLELAFVAAPKSMKSFVTACFLLTSSIASYANGLITPLYSKTTEGVRLFTPMQYFGAQVILALAAMLALYFVAKPFNRRLAEQTAT